MRVRGAKRVSVLSTMEKRFFTLEEEEILIDLISEYPPLYSSKDEAFKDKDLKATIWRKIADSLGKNEDACKTKWKNLRDYYNKKKRGAAAVTSSMSSGNARKYDRYRRMKFLDSELADPRSSNADTSTISEEENFLTQDVYEQPSMKDISLEYDQNMSIPADDPESPTLPYKKAKLNTSNRQRLLMQYLQAAEDGIDMSGELESPKNIIVCDDSNESPSYATFATTQGDPLEDFFRGIITTVKMFTPELQIQAKRRISNLVFDLEQEALSSKANTSEATIDKAVH